MNNLMSRQWLSKPEVENLFVQAAAALHINITVDRIDDLSEERGYCIRSHDSCGRIPEIEVEYADDKEYILDRITFALERLYIDLGC